MNSSMRKLLLAGVNLNGCLLKDPLTLADLYTVKLGIWKDKVTLIDILRFY
jgi:hypothetical protein